jgi:hypothetical protein
LSAGLREIGLRSINGWGVYGERPITEEEIQREMKKGGDAAHPRDP